MKVQEEKVLAIENFSDEKVKGLTQNLVSIGDM
jgi:hypothetical protein